MYVRVHKTCNQWFRTDNGTLVGTEASLAIGRNRNYYARLNNDCIILVVDVHNNYKSVFKGFLKKDGTLIRDKNSSERYIFVLG